MHPVHAALAGIATVRVRASAKHALLEINMDAPPEIIVTPVVHVPRLWRMANRALPVAMEISNVHPETARTVEQAFAVILDIDVAARTAIASQDRHACHLIAKSEI